MSIGPRRPTRRPALATLVAALALALLAGCGGEDAPPGPATTSVAPPPAASPFVAPPAVPRQGTGPADGADRDVIDRWLETLRAGDEVGAGRMFAPGARVQNASRVFTVRSLAERVQFQRVLSCGAIDRAAVAAADHFTIVTFELVERPGGSCGTGVGALARAAIQVRGGRITGWYRLPGGSYQEDAGPQVAA